jgi:UDP-N-acetylmuramoyl-L-alanyl-D-glutamate--2,6-diaminopimelate ligase
MPRSFRHAAGEAVIRFEEAPRILGDLVVGPLPERWPTGEIAGIEQDSRRILPRSLFVCIKGSQDDGRAYLADAAGRGALAAIGEPPVSDLLPFLPVTNARRAVALLAARWNDDPSHTLDVVGITGTNGKTTVSWLLQSIWEGCGIPAAVSGTLGVGRPETLSGGTHTTPDAPRFQSALRSLREDGFRAVAAEVSSHALDQDRVYGTRFRAVVFTNLTRDHLDYHHTLERYRDAKRKLFNPQGRGDSSPCYAVVNLDDPASSEILRGSPDSLRGYGTSPGCFVRLQDLQARADGIDLRLATRMGDRQIHTPMIGAYNGWNVLAAYTTALVLDLPVEQVESTLARGIGVPGRMERIDCGQPFLVLVDYAHTPDALTRAMAALRPVSRGRLIVLFGCGGDRDQGKRGEMGAAVAATADQIILTSDNPRTEDPLAIIEAVRAGVMARGREATLVTVDREEAIFAAIAMGEEHDTILIAGKGHENYQEIGTTRRPFDDREVARRALASRGWKR